MPLRDSRSYKVVFTPDYVINPENYPNIPKSLKIYEGIKRAGYGIVKLPVIDISEDQISDWIEIAADMIEEYQKRGYAIALLIVNCLEDGGIWLSKLRAELESRKLTIPKIVEFSESELEEDEEIFSKIESIF